MNLDTYRQKIGKAYFEIETLIDNMQRDLTFAREYPAEITQSQAFDVKRFIDNVDDLIHDYFDTFIEFDDE